MLELRNIKKDYQLKDQEPVHALKGISLQFRENEFVAILGPSGCGKTTLLNITGGLDHYDSGDLIIKGVSTKNFKDGDWDTYRNHSIGFVFQSYNLIPHQNILSNVELALTIGGVSKEERKRRAKEALDLVGLKGLYRKKPNQLSGGQMQRVAIARALVNNPEIVLADEPTGALDSETSTQIMDILRDISKNHLVIMVTHNPDLAEEYATRIVKMKDGEILSDSNPYDEKFQPKVEEEDVNKGNKKHSSMSFFTATGLSVSNLLSKLKRTILVSIAGSIGIIGVSTILGVSCGVNDYIADMEDDMLSSYPISIKEETADLSSVMMNVNFGDAVEAAQFDTTTQVGMDSMISYLMNRYTDLTNVKTNDINENLVNYVAEMPESYYSAITYGYGLDPTNNIFTAFKAEESSATADIVSINGLTQRYIKTLMTVPGYSTFNTFTSLFTNFMKQAPKEENYILSQYDLLGNSKYPTEPNEMMLVVDSNSNLTDLILAQMGYYPQDEFLKIAYRAEADRESQMRFNEGSISMAEYQEELKENAEKYQYQSVFNIDDILNHEFYYYPHDVVYEEDPYFVTHNTVVASMTGVDANGNRTILSVSYLADTDSLTGTYLVLDNTSQVINNEYAVMIRQSQRDTNKSVLDGMWIGTTTTTRTGLVLSVDTNDNPEIDGNTTYYTFNPMGSFIMQADIESLTPDYATLASITSGKVTEVTPETPDFYYEAYVENNPKIAGKDVSEIDGAMKMKVVGILRAKPTTNFGTLSRGVYYTTAFAQKYMNDASNSEIISEYKEHIEEERFALSDFNLYVHFIYDDYSQDVDNPTRGVPGYASALNSDFTSTLSNLFLSFMNNMGGENEVSDDERAHLRALSGLKIVEVNDDFSTTLLPESISIYPKNFEQKDNVTRYLDKWNSDETIYIKNKTVAIEAKDREEITYSDTISIIVAVISTLVTTISAALISFTSLSLVVSCFMIAVITYISVMERVKEIGVIRSLGGRKKDVSRLFTAENLITGLASGVFGIGITYILQIIINIIVHVFGAPNICALPWYYALMMIGISILLSILSGGIPSRSASKQDPVIALRTE